MSAPVKHTCPDIDQVIKSIRMALKVTKNAMKQFKGEESYVYFDEIDAELYMLEGQLEDLRDANKALREWGEELDAELQGAAETIFTLENQLREIPST